MHSTCQHSQLKTNKGISKVTCLYSKTLIFVVRLVLTLRQIVKWV